MVCVTYLTSRGINSLGSVNSFIKIFPFFEFPFSCQCMGFFHSTLWLIVTVVGFIASNVLVDTFWLRYKANPTRLKVDSFHQPLNMLDLPAITICQGQHIDEERARMFIDELLVTESNGKRFWFGKASPLKREEYLRANLRH